MTFRQWFRQIAFPRIAAPISYYLLRALLKTCRITIEQGENLTQTASKSSCLLGLWHDQLAPSAYILQQFAAHFNYAPIISQSRDGELLTRHCEYYPQVQTIRVPHNARVQALRTIVDAAQTGKKIIVITPDGPRGPRRQMKPGAVLASKQGQIPFIPFSWKASRFWTLPSWDQMTIPKPFSTIKVKIGKAKMVTTLEEAQAMLDEAQV